MKRNRDKDVLGNEKGVLGKEKYALGSESDRYFVTKFESYNIFYFGMELVC